MIVGGGLFTSYADLPRELAPLPRLGIKSTAAGRYRLLSRCYDAYCRLLGQKDFSPLSQDLIAIQQIRERRALELIKAYGQHEWKLDDLLAAYRKAGGVVVS